MIRLTVKRAAVTLCLVAVLVGCLVGQIFQQKAFAYSYSDQPHHNMQVYSGAASIRAITIDAYCKFALLPAFSEETAQGDANFTRGQIYAYIDQNPGVQFRAICTALSLPVGLVQYYLNGLVKTGLVSYVRDGRYKRFFVSKRFSKREKAAISLLRHRLARLIVEVLLRKGQVSHCRLACEVAVSSQALTWQMKALKETQYIVQVIDGKNTVYSLNTASTGLLKKSLVAVSIQF